MRNAFDWRSIGGHVRARPDVELRDERRPLRFVDARGRCTAAFDAFNDEMRRIALGHGGRYVGFRRRRY